MYNEAKQRRRLFTPVVAAIAVALVVAMSGSATAAIMVGSNQIKKNAVGTKHLKKGAVGSAKIKNRAVNGKKIKAKAIKPGHLSPAALNQLTGEQGPKGDKGDRGPEGPQGPKGDQGPKGEDAGVKLRVVEEQLLIHDETTETVEAYCEQGETAVSGTFRTTRGGMVVQEILPWTKPSADNYLNGWRADVANVLQAEESSGRLTVLCMEN